MAAIKFHPDYPGAPASFQGIAYESGTCPYYPYDKRDCNFCRAHQEEYAAWLSARESSVSVAELQEEIDKLKAANDRLFERNERQYYIIRQLEEVEQVLRKRLTDQIAEKHPYIRSPA